MDTDVKNPLAINNCILFNSIIFSDLKAFCCGSQYSITEGAD